METQESREVRKRTAVGIVGIRVPKAEVPFRHLLRHFHARLRFPVTPGCGLTLVQNEQRQDALDTEDAVVVLLDKCEHLRVTFHRVQRVMEVLVLRNVSSPLKASTLANKLATYEVLIVNHSTSNCGAGLAGEIELHGVLESIVEYRWQERKLLRSPSRAYVAPEDLH